MGQQSSFAKLVKYGITGVFGTVLYALVVGLLVELVGLRPTLAACLAFVATIVSCFPINNYWTFRSGAASWQRFTKYALVSILGLLLTLVITYSGEVLEVWYVYVQFVVVVAIPLSNYLMNNYWVFTTKQQQEALPASPESISE